ncbi:sulfate adenylyltransferase subunit 1 [Brevibacterium aurantiacum]|uniref:sulfate adenylyltransferase n=1 Tax=Brevibacterium aurantiacum TaxID=273384 RepID=A0A1D7W1S5_BREAU|nr:GTP-binding protein [Brevibacterium aurantiacum]AOP52894.1 Sulfate adenylyltransferase subunit 1 [Brevibacterium aurantiacum]RCS95053.1 sulfate adenylyltransferase [Brevibacterium aurantiacum]
MTTTPDTSAATQTKTLLRFATAGSVDDGKSTLVGRLLHDAKAILADQLEAVTRTSEERGFVGGEFDFALLTDGLRAEREQGITIDVAYRYFATDKRSFILADCPGHVQYTRNMVTGATTADAVVVLIDARTGATEQTRRHLTVVHRLGIGHVILAINKIDLLDYDHAAYAKVEAEIEALTAEIGLDSAHLIPVSALAGDNVAEASANTPWYQGPALLELLENLPSKEEDTADLEPFRLDVQSVLRPQGGLAPGLDPDEFRDYRAVTGQVTSGRIRLGDEIDVHPAGLRTTVVGIDTADGPLETAGAPLSVALRLADDIDTARGSVLAAAGSLPEPRKALRAEVFPFTSQGLRSGDRVLVKAGTSTVKAIVTIESKHNLLTAGSEPAEVLAGNDIGTAEVKLATALPLADFREHGRAGGFLIIDPQTGSTVAAGIHTPEDAHTPEGEQS